MEAVEEQVCRLEVNGRFVATWSASPGGERELAAGRLVAEGFLRAPGELLAFRSGRDDAGASVLSAELAAEAAERGFAEREHRSTCRLGLLHFLVCDGSTLGSRRAGVPPDTDRVRTLMRDLFAGSPARGLHAAALGAGDRLRHRVEEVGRHNAVDKAIGAGLLAGESLEELGLVVSSRISGEIAVKAARAGLAWIASRSIPTTLAIRIAEAASLPILARAGTASSEVS